MLRHRLLAARLPACTAGGGEDDEDSDIVGILLTPEEVVVPLGQELQLHATGLTDDRESVDLTATVQWCSSDEAVLSASDDLDQEGLAVGLQAGSATVEAEVDGVEAVPLTVTVTDAGGERLAVYPSALDLAPGDAVQLVATAWWSDGSASDATAQFRWITGDGAVATRSAEGLLTAQADGETQMHAGWGAARSADVPVLVSGEGGRLAAACPIARSPPPRARSAGARWIARSRARTLATGPPPTSGWTSSSTGGPLPPVTSGTPSPG